MEKTNDEKRYCVYMHRFRDTGKVYIGQTCRVPKKRWGTNGRRYLIKKKNGEYYQPLMARAIIKYGWENCDHIILFDNLDKKAADRIEQICIVLFRATDRRFGLNIALGGSNIITEETKQKLSIAQKKRFENPENHPMYGKHLSDETKEKMRKAHRGKQFSKEHKNKMSEAETGYKNHQSKSVFCIELNKVFLTILEVEKCTNISDSSISNCCHGKRESVFGYHFRWATQDEIIAEKQRRGIEVV